jgi:hypothetical protein
MHDRTALYLTALAAAILAAAVLVLQPYSVRSPWAAYSEPVRRYLRAAAASDSAALARQSVDSRAVDWALAAARRRPDWVAAWGDRAVAWAGTRHADTADVFVAPPGSSCTMAVRLVGRPPAARVEAASSGCLDMP